MFGGWFFVSLCVGDLFNKKPKPNEPNHSIVSAPGASGSVVCYGVDKIKTIRKHTNNYSYGWSMRHVHNEENLFSYTTYIQ